MRLCTYSVEPGASRLGAVCGAAVLDLGRYSHLHEGLRLPTDMLGLLDAGPDAWRHAAELCRRFAAELSSHDLNQDAEAGLAFAADRVRQLAPIPRPRKDVFCLGQNYAAHAAESGSPPPTAPIYFTKPPTTVIGPGEAIPYPQGLTTRLDWEVELGVVIGLGGRDIPEARALDHVFGYTVFNDVSARDLQYRTSQWFKGKSLDGSCPMGPVIVTADEIPDPQRLCLQLSVNGVAKQDSNTGDMIFSVARIIADLSAGMTLEPGDCISTGTPQGVGDGRKPPEYLKRGDVMDAEVERIGLLRNPVR
ncbi:MAG TPA: fumarylacetoacetate hydrolase family protein [Candidatus Dormibacteraeota bacterium]|nr:fumarylacetoacetate hydrolase family protein [Candidatus Dormibacteraeota bacterium]